MALGLGVLCSRSANCEFKTWLTVLRIQGTGHMAAQGKFFPQDEFPYNRKIHLKTYGTVKELLPPL